MAGREFDLETVDFHLVDVRYSYEFAGGHVQGAVNIGDVSQLHAYFFDPLRLAESQQSVGTRKKVVIVFHCEYSIQRAPQMYILIDLGRFIFARLTGTSMRWRTLLSSTPISISSKVGSVHITSTAQKGVCQMVATSK